MKEPTIVVTERQIDTLAEEIKAFKAGIIDAKLDRHIDDCIIRFTANAVRPKPWWRLW